MKFPRLLLFPCVFPCLLAAEQAEDSATRLMHCTYKLFNAKSTATCFLVADEKDAGPLFVVTAAHVFEKAEGETSILVLRKQDDAGKFVRYDFSVAIRRGKEALWKKHPDQDVAVLRLDKAPDAGYRALPLSALASLEDWKTAGIHVCGEAGVFGFPFRFEASKAGFPVGRRAIVAGFPLPPSPDAPTFLLDFNTYEGDSGGPVFVPSPSDPGQPMVIGMVIAQFRHDEKIEIAYEERVRHHPLQIANAVHSGWIRETIDLARSS